MREDQFIFLLNYYTCIYHFGIFHFFTDPILTLFQMKSRWIISNALRWIILGTKHQSSPRSEEIYQSQSSQVVDLLYNVWICSLKTLVLCWFELFILELTHYQPQPCLNQRRIQDFLYSRGGQKIAHNAHPLRCLGGGEWDRATVLNQPLNLINVDYIFSLI